MISTICICGAGTMGSGIAQVAAQSGISTILFDLDAEVLEKAKSDIYKNLEHLAVRQKISTGEINEIFRRINYVTDFRSCTAEVIIEAIVENINSKVALINQLAEINSNEVIFATNTSSLRVSEIQQKVLHPHRVAGMHFFNPAPLMKLVEVIKGDQTSEPVVNTVYALAKQMGKTPVMCKDTPGFIVNRIARQYYLEAMKLVEDKVASLENIDVIMEAAGFKMGPFKLMDLIGMDINLSVSQSIYDAFDNVQRFRPSELQIDKVNRSELGRKSGKGFYEYSS